MKTFARIEGGQVAELLSTAGDITQMFVPSMVWVDVTAVTPSPAVGWSATQNAGGWSLAPPSGPKAAATVSAVEATAPLLLVGGAPPSATRYFRSTGE